MARKSQNRHPIAQRAKGALISEPRFSTPCKMHFFPREKGKTAFVEGFSLKNAVFPFSRGKNRISQGVENWGSLISAPLALRAIAQNRHDELEMRYLVAQCSATPATVAATPPCSATPFQTQISVRHLPAQGGGGATPKLLGGVARHRCYTCKTL